MSVGPVVVLVLLGLTLAYWLAARGGRGALQSAARAAAIELPRQFPSISTVELSSDGKVHWFTGSHQGHEFAFTAVAFPRLRKGPGSTVSIRGLTLFVALNRQDPVATTTHPVVRYQHRKCPADARFADCILVTGKRRLPEPAMDKMLQFFKDFGFVRLRDRNVQAGPVLPNGLLRGKEAVLVYAGTGRQFLGGGLDNGRRISELLDQMVDIARELQW